MLKSLSMFKLAKYGTMSLISVGMAVSCENPLVGRPVHLKVIKLLVTDDCILPIHASLS